MDSLINVNHLVPRAKVDSQASVQRALTNMIETSLKEACAAPASHPELKSIQIRNQFERQAAPFKSIGKNDQNPDLLSIQSRQGSMLNQYQSERIYQQARNIEYRQLFQKLGLDYEQDVPKNIKQQLESDKNSRQILQNLTRKFENGEFTKYLKSNEQK